MKQCKDCNTEMIEAEILGKHPFKVGFESRVNIFVETDEDIGRNELKAIVCPKCGKVELYVDLEEN